MSLLPKADLPVYTTEQPSTGKKVKYRSFLVREQKILLMAAESKDTKEITDAVKNIIEACFFNEIDVNKIPSFDLEHFFIKLRMASVGEVSEIGYVCNHKDENGNKCNNEITLKIDLGDVKINKKPNLKDRTIKISEQAGFVMNYPTVDTLQELMEEEDSMTRLFFKTIFNCIDYVFNGDEISTLDGIDYEDFIEEFEEYPKSIIEEFDEFFNNIPCMEYHAKLKCDKCETEDEFPIRGIKNFF